jgi:hypothetical protein
MPGLLIESLVPEVGINAVADFAAGDVASDVFNMRDYDSVLFLVHWGVGTTGVVKLTVDACDDVVPTNTAKIPFHSRKMIAAGTIGAVTLADKDDGVSNLAGSNQLFLIEVRAQALAASGYNYVRVNVDETTDDPLLGCVLVLGAKPRFAGTDAVPTSTV